MWFFIIAAFIEIAVMSTIYFMLKITLQRSVVSKRLFKGKRYQNLNKLKDINKLIKNTPIKNKGLFAKLEKLLNDASINIGVNKFIKIFLAVSIFIYSFAFIATNSIIISVIIIVIATVLTYVGLRHLKNKRISMMSAQLYDIIAFLSGSLKSGYSLMQSINVIAKEFPPPASLEFRNVIDDINMGKSYDDAFSKMVERNPLEEIQILVTAILISKETGGNLSHVLDIVSENINERKKITGELKSLTAQGRLSGIILNMLPISVFALLAVLNPGYLAPMLSTNIGRIILIVGACNQFIGALLIKKITKIEW